jgi:hypothetical protein
MPFSVDADGDFAGPVKSESQWLWLASFPIAVLPEGHYDLLNFFYHSSN